MSRKPEPISNRSVWSPDFSSGAESVATRLRLLYGEVEWPQQHGLLHVAAVEAATRRVMIPGAFAPASPVDRFVLGVSRARADAIVTTGAILRSEPGLRHDPGDTPPENAALLEWRRDELGRRETPQLIVLSGSGDLPLAHPAIAAARAGTILTTEAGARRLPARVGALDVQVGDPGEAPIVGAVRVAREIGAQETSAAQTIAIEAGPTATAPLYLSVAPSASNEDAVGSAACCDELLLSRFEGSLDARALGPAFFDETAIERVFGHVVASERIEDALGIWRFDRYRRAATSFA